MIRFLRRLLAVLLVCLIVAVLGAWIALRGSLPRYAGEVVAPALESAVTVERDALGSVTVHAGNRHDVTWSLGYVQAQERYFEMDLLRRRAAGELAEIFGAAVLPADRTARTHRMRARTQEAYAALPAEQRATIDTYRDGINAGLAALSVRPFAYLLTRTTPAPWRSEDTLLVIAAMAFTLTDAENKRELAFAQMHAALPESAFRFLVASGGEWDAPIVGAALAWPEPPSSGELDLHALDPNLLHPTDASTDRFPGSNNFAVAGKLAGGAALVANDAHLDLRVPGLWFRVRLIYPDPHHPGRNVDISGAGLPGMPSVVIGSNGKVAWSFTNGYIDTADWVRVTRDPADPGRYRVADGWASISKHTEILHALGAPDATLEIEETQWGPIVAKDADGTSLALAWTAHQPGALDLGLGRMDEAATVAEAVAIAQTSGIPPQNLIVGDDTGNIAWTIAGRIPKRIGGFDPALPGDWSQAGAGWNGWIAAGDVPLLSNPPDDRLWTANQRVVGDAALATLGDAGYDLGARARQIRDGLRARANFTPADMLAIQLDDRALMLERWKDLMQRELERAPTSALKERMKKILADWTGEASVDSVSYRLVRAWRNEVVDSVLDAFSAAVRSRFPDFAMPKMALVENAVWKLLEQRPLHLLPPGHADWDALLVACAERSGTKLDGQPGGLAARTWGERNTMHIAHPLSRALPAFIARRLDMPYQPLPGDINMPRVQGPAFGASERFAVRPGDEAHGYFMMSGGQSGHPLSPYYGAGHQDWAEGKPTPFLPGPPQQTLMFVP